METAFHQLRIPLHRAGGGCWLKPAEHCELKDDITLQRIETKPWEMIAEINTERRKVKRPGPIPNGEERREEREVILNPWILKKKCQNMLMDYFGLLHLAGCWKMRRDDPNVRTAGMNANCKVIITGQLSEPMWSGTREPRAELKHYLIAGGDTMEQSVLLCPRGCGDTSATNYEFLALTLWCRNVDVLQTLEHLPASQPSAQMG